MKSTYSFGVDSPMKFTLSDSFAETYNNALDKFFKAQRRFTQKFGAAWDPETNPVKVNWTRKEKKVWNEFPKIFAKVNAQHGPFGAVDFYDDYLIREAAYAVLKPLPFSRPIMFAASAGALYVILRRL